MADKCGCGCSQLVKKGNRFIYGHNNKGRFLSAETKKKISEARRGHKTSEDTRGKIGNAHRGKKVSEEVREKIRRTLTGRKHTEKNKRM